MASNSALGPHSRQRSREHANNDAGTGTARPRRLLLKLATLVAAVVLFLGSELSMAAQACTPPPANCPCRQPPKNPTSGKSYTAIDLSVVTRHEGGDQLQAYSFSARPTAGVTVGIGVDLNYQTAAGLKSEGVSQALIDKLTPYLGLNGTTTPTATQKIATNPLALTADEAAALDQAVMSGKFSDAAAAFNAKSTGFKFSDLPWQAQTVLADLYYTEGHGAPNLWSQIMNKDWDAAYNNLMDYTQKDPRLADRAKADAYWFKQAMDACTLPPG